MIFEESKYRIEEVRIRRHILDIIDQWGGIEADDFVFLNGSAKFKLISIHRGAFRGKRQSCCDYPRFLWPDRAIGRPDSWVSTGARFWRPRRRPLSDRPPLIPTVDGSGVV